MAEDSPRNAATVVVIDMNGGAPRLLMGQRNARQVFMPDVFVFPGGRVDEADANANLATPLSAVERTKLAIDVPDMGPAIAPHALAVTALRELHEETGYRLAPADDGSPGYDLGDLTYFARAITPPGQSRRYDTRFFAATRAETLQRVADGDGELGNIGWYTLAEIAELKTAGITRQIIGDVARRLDAGPPNAWTDDVWLIRHVGTGFTKTGLTNLAGRPLDPDRPS
ncbi:MAG: NUDIX hydrolase [Pseudomonadota bacterium]